MTQPVATESYSIAVGSVSTTAFITAIVNRAPTGNDLNFPVQKRWLNTLTGLEYFLLNFTSTGGIIQANWIQLTGGTTALNELTGNTGGPVGPSGGNIDVVGDGTSILIVGNPGTFTLTANVILPASPHQILIGQTSSISGLGVATNGQIPIGSTGADPVLATITSTDGSITITNGAGTINLGATAFLTGTVTTVGHVTGDLITFSLGASALAYKFKFEVVAYNAATPAALGYSIDATARTTGAAATVVGTPDGDEDEDAVLVTDADWSVIASANNVILRVTGVTGLTLHWRAQGRYVTVV